MSNFNQGNRKPFVPTYLNEMRMRLMGPVLNGAERASSLSFKMKKNRPVVSVRTNLPNDKNFGLIDAELDAMSFEVLIGMLQNARDMEPGTKEALRTLDFPWSGQGRSKELKPQTTVIVGREPDGLIYLAVTSWDQSRPVIKFPVVPSQYVQYIKNDGQVLTAVDASIKWSRAWAGVLRELMYDLLRANYEEPQRNTRQNNGGQGGYQQNSGGGQQQNYQQPSSSAPAPAGGESGDGWGNDGWPM